MKGGLIAVANRLIESVPIINLPQTSFPNLRRLAFVVVILHCSLVVGVDDVSDDGSTAAYLMSHCLSCHNPDENSGGIDFTKLSEFKPVNVELWQDILNNI